MPACPTPACLARLLAEQLTPVEYGAIETHLEDCARCQQELERLTAATAGLRSPIQGTGGRSFPGEEACWLRVQQALRETVAIPAGTSSREKEASNGAGSPAAPEELPGYEVLEELGRGASGIVYKARRLCADQLVAVKVLRCRPHRDKLARFRREIETLVWLNHPHIVKIHEIGEHRGRPFFAMEYVSGGNLQRRLAGGPLPVAEAVSLLTTLARVVQAAHDRAIIHRDLKPANVLLAADGSPRIMDFGLAKHLSDVTDLTDSGTILGTPCYMAPEQAWGQAHQAGPPADVYSLGAILYEALTGRPPFQGSTLHEILEQARSGNPVSPRGCRPDVPAEVEQICLRCLAKKPSERFATAGELADALAGAATGPMVVPSVPSAIAAEAPHTLASPGLGARVIIGMLAVGCATIMLGLLVLQLAPGLDHSGAARPKPSQPQPSIQQPLLPSAPPPVVAKAGATSELKGIVIGKPFNNHHQFLAAVGGQETNFAFAGGARAFDTRGEELDPPEIKRVNKAGNVVDVVVESSAVFNLKTIREIRLVQGELVPADQMTPSFMLSAAPNGERDYLGAVVQRWDARDNSLRVRSGGREVILYLDLRRTQVNDGTGQQLFRQEMVRVLKEGNVVDIRTRTISNKPTATVIVLRKGKLLTAKEVANLQ